MNEKGICSFCTISCLGVVLFFLSFRGHSLRVKSKPDSVLEERVLVYDSLLSAGKASVVEGLIRSEIESAKQKGYESHFSILEGIANLFWSRNELSKALPYLLDALDVAKVSMDGNLQIQALNNIGTFYASYDRAEQSVQAFRDMLLLAEKHSSQRDIDVSSFKLGSMLMRLDSPQYQASLTYLHNSKKTFELEKDSIMLAKVYGNIALNHEEMNNLDSALIWLEKSVSIERALRYWESLIISFHNLGLLLYRKGEFEGAYKAFNKSLLGADSLKYSTASRDKAKAFFGMAASNHKLGKYEKSIELFLKYDTISSAYYTSEFNDLLTQKEVESGLLEERRINDIRTLELERQRQRNIITTFVLVFLAIFICLWIYVNENKKRNLKLLGLKNQELANQKINDLLQQQEINSLQGVLAGQEKERQRIAADLHDKLGAILGMVKLHFSAVEERIDVLRDDNKKQYDKANELLDQASTEVRNISHNLLSGVLVKFGLVPALQDLKATVEATGKLKVQLVTGEQMDGRLNGEQELQIYRIVQELISNILKHAKATEAVVQLNRTNGEINLIVEDNGIGFDVEAARQKQGIGLRNLEARAAKLNAKLHFDSGKGAGTTVSVDIPLNSGDL